MRRLRVFLDTNVLFSARLRAVFLGFVESKCVDVYWSEEVLVELERTLQKQISAEKAERLTTVLRVKFPLSIVSWEETTADSLVLPDPNDVHVLAAAITGECDLLITDNIDDFPDSAIPNTADLLVLDANMGIQYLAGEFAADVPALLERTVSGLSKPPMSVDEFIKGIEKIAPIGAVTLAAANGDVDALAIYANTLDSASEHAPQHAIEQLVRRLKEGDDVTELATTALIERTEAAGYSVVQYVQTELHRVLETDGWGFGTEPRYKSPNQVKVVLARTGSDQIEIVQREDHSIERIAFVLEQEGDRWLLEAIVEY